MKTGVVGAGAIARRGHLPVYRTIPEIEVVGIADLDLSLAEKVAAETKIGFEHLITNVAFITTER